MTPNDGLSMGKVLYGSLFLIVLPGGLFMWAKMTEASIRLPVPGSVATGVAIALGGAAIMAAGMIAIMIYGKGLPMNAFPPLRYVSEGVYKFTPHPIYTGFSMLCVGVAMAAHSASGLWLVSPTVMLGCVALVAGYEKDDLRRRFGAAVTRPLLHLPENELTAPAWNDRLSVYVLVLLPWLILYEAVVWMGIPTDAVVASLPFEQDLPVYEWTEVFYASTYVVVLLAPFVARTKRDLREFSIQALMATGLLVLLFLVVPLIALPRPFTPHGGLGRLLALERRYDSPAAAFPSFHVVWAFLAARVYARRLPSLRALGWTWAALVSISCITTGMHAVVDVLSGFIVFLLVAHMSAIWERTRHLTERIANSWREWRFGPVRIINHGLYAGLGAAVALSIVGTLIGSRHITAMMIIATSVVMAAAIWAQLIEGSPSLLRPYGWYGGLLGAVIGALIAGLLGADPWLLLAAFSVAAPWVQSAGRLRCLIQGCCHGRATSAAIGIHYRHPRSRVCRLANLAAVPIHPTPLYSILWNMVIAVIMARLWFLHTSLSLIVGIYLILMGLGRFVEEAYRGEPQTAIYAGLRLYQWLAILSVLAGILVTLIKDTAAAPAAAPNWASIAAACGYGVITWFALGVDFPNSNRRFARLA